MTRFGRTWWGRAWVEALEGRARLDPNRLPRGRTYARRTGAVGELAVAPGEVRAAVRGSRPRPYDVRVRVRAFTGAEWDRLLDAVAGQVGHTAALLDGELPPSVADDVRGTGLDLLPGPGDVQPRCSCPDWADPCKHSAAVCYLVADRLDADPFALLLLRGRTREEVLAGLRARRSAGAAPALPSPPVVDAGVPAAAAYAVAAAPRPLPRPPLPAARPGRPAALAVDPPPGSGLRAAALTALAADAAERALALAMGDGDGGLGLSREADLARRAAGLLDGPGLAELAARSGVAGRDLLRRALAWRYGGLGGLDVLAGSWQPAGETVDEGRRALGPGARAWRNRVTRDEAQLRYGADGRWHPYRRADDGWDPAGPPDVDPAVLVGGG